MKLSIDSSKLAGYVASQLSNFFPDVTVSGERMKPYVDHALERADYCFTHVKNKYFHQNGEAVFNHLHTDQYAMFLYLLSNSIYRISKDADLAARVYALNKALHAIDVFYEVELPGIFYFQHPLGTVLGRAKYSDYLFVYPRCNVGANLDDVYPRIGEGVIMYGGSAIIGDCTVGDNSWLSLGATVMNQDVPPGSVVFGGPPNMVIKPTSRNVVNDMFLPSGGRGLD